MNNSQIEAQRRQLNAEAADVDARLAMATETKSFDMLSDLEKRVNALAEARAELDQAEATASAVERFQTRFPDATDSVEGEPADFVTNAFKSGREVNPLVMSQDSLQTIYKAAKSRQAISCKAYSTIGGLLPAQLDPNILGKIHESRLLDRLPTQAISAPSYEILVHASTTGAPAPVAEGGQKPEVVLNMTSQTVTAVKVAAHVGISYESLSDFPTFLGYATTELTRMMADTENSEILNGSGTGGHMTGLLNTSGILTHDASTDTGTNVTAIDGIEKAIAQLRVGSALADADLLILHPQTWSAIRRLKDTVGRYLFVSSDSDVTTAQANSIFNVPVLVTTAMTAGAGLMLDTSKFGRVFVREGITIHTGQNTDDFTKNISRFVLESRFVLGVERPAAVCAISNLPAA